MLKHESFYEKYPQYLIPELKESDFKEILTIPTGFEEDEFVIIHYHSKEVPFSLYASRGNGSNDFLGNFKTLEETKEYY
jgi:hypothetical protein